MSVCDMHLFCDMMKVDCQPYAVVALTNSLSHSCLSGSLTSQMFAFTFRLNDLVAVQPSGPNVVL